jgi:hypothetical protein
MKVRSKDELKILMRIKQDERVKEAIPKKKDDRPEVQVKPICLLMGYMFDLLEESDLQNEGIKQDLENILKTIPSFFDIMLTQTMTLAQLAKMGRSPKRITARNIMTLIQFSQNLMQGGWIYKDPFTQLPHFQETEIKNIKPLLNGKTLLNYCKMTRDERKELVPKIFGDDAQAMQKFEDQERCISALPLVKLTMTAYVEGEDEIVVGDILTCKLRVDYLNLDKGHKSGYVHSKHYPYLKRDNWYLIITDETLTGLAAVEKLTITENFFEKKFQERVVRPGKIAFTAILTNDSYRGLDYFSKVEVNVVQEAVNR